MTNLPHANDDQTRYDPGPSRIHWNVRPRDLHILAASIVTAGVVLAGGVVWSAHIEAQADRCGRAVDALNAAEFEPGDTARAFTVYGCEDR